MTKFWELYFLEWSSFEAVSYGILLSLRTSRIERVPDTLILIQQFCIAQLLSINIFHSGLKKIIFSNNNYEIGKAPGISEAWLSSVVSGKNSASKSASLASSTSPHATDSGPAHFQPMLGSYFQISLRQDFRSSFRDIDLFFHLSG